MLPAVSWLVPDVDPMFRHLEELRQEWTAFPAASDDPAVFHYDNPFFSLADAAVCHAFVRTHRPPVVVEVGSGHSTRVLRQALDRNGSGRLVAIDPEPRLEVASLADEARRVRVQTLPLGFFESLPEGSLLFIDSSHLVGAGSDVNYLYLDVLPALKPGTLVHVHDIYLPEDYPPEQNLGAGGWHYTEQYLLQALLTGSSQFEVLWPGRHVYRTRWADLHRLIPRPDLLGLHCSFWMRRL